MTEPETLIQQLRAVQDKLEIITERVAEYQPVSRTIRDLKSVLEANDAILMRLEKIPHNPDECGGNGIYCATCEDMYKS